MMTPESILRSSPAVTASLLTFAVNHVCAANAPLSIGSWREQFVDDAPVEKLT